MKFELGRYDVKIVFKHGLSAYHGMPRMGTYCRIYLDDRLTVIGVATCNPVDQFKEEKGRQVALARAIEGYDSGTRTAIWHAYHMRSDTTIGRIQQAHKGLTPDDIYRLTGGRSLGVSGYHNVEVHRYEFWPFYCISYLDHDSYLGRLNLGVHNAQTRTPPIP